MVNNILTYCASHENNKMIIKKSKYIKAHVNMYVIFFYTLSSESLFTNNKPSFVVFCFSQII